MLGILRVAVWRHARAAALGEAGARLDPSSFATAWRTAIEKPPTPAHRVLVAVDGESVLGFAALAPTGPAVVEVVALEVDPAATGAGHGSRLLAACADLAHEDGARLLRIWVLEGDGARADFLRSAGLAPDGATRLLDVDGRPVRENRWSAAL